jgi:hypothetical protein
MKAIFLNVNLSSASSDLSFPENNSFVLQLRRLFSGYEFTIHWPWAICVFNWWSNCNMKWLPYAFLNIRCFREAIHAVILILMLWHCWSRINIANTIDFIIDCFRLRIFYCKYGLLFYYTTESKRWFNFNSMRECFRMILEEEIII